MYELLTNAFIEGFSDVRPHIHTDEIRKHAASILTVSPEDQTTHNNITKCEQELAALKSSCDLKDMKCSVPTPNLIPFPLSLAKLLTYFRTNNTPFEISPIVFTTVTLKWATGSASIPFPTGSNDPVNLDTTIDWKPSQPVSIENNRIVPLKPRSIRADIRDMLNANTYRSQKTQRQSPFYMEMMRRLRNGSKFEYSTSEKFTTNLEITLKVSKTDSAQATKKAIAKQTQQLKELKQSLAGCLEKARALGSSTASTRQFEEINLRAHLEQLRNSIELYKQRFFELAPQVLYKEDKSEAVIKLPTWDWPRIKTVSSNIRQRWDGLKSQFSTATSEIQEIEEKLKAFIIVKEISLPTTAATETKPCNYVNMEFSF